MVKASSSPLFLPEAQLISVGSFARETASCRCVLLLNVQDKILLCSYKHCIYYAAFRVFFPLSLFFFFPCSHNSNLLFTYDIGLNSYFRCTDSKYSWRCDWSLMWWWPLVIHTDVDIDPCVFVGERCGFVQCDPRAGGSSSEERRTDRYHRSPVQTRGWALQTCSHMASLFFPLLLKLLQMAR